MLPQKNFSTFTSTNSFVDTKKIASYKHRIERAQGKIDMINQYLQKVADSQMETKKFCFEIKNKLCIPNLSQEKINYYENALTRVLDDIETLSRLTEENTRKIINLTIRVFNNKQKLARAEILSNYAEEESDSKGAAPAA